MREIFRIVKEKGYKRIGLQFPEGLKWKATEIMQDLEAHGVTVFLSLDPCYGACDLADKEMEELGVEALFHVGHSKILDNTAIPVFYIEYKIDFDIFPCIEENLDILPDRIGLITNIQHIHMISSVKKFLEEKGKKVFVGLPKGRAKYAGQVLGCDFSAARCIMKKVDGFLYFGSGDFHPLGVALATKKTTLALDMGGDIKDIGKKARKILKQRYSIIAKAVEAESFGILIGEKRGQRRLELAMKLKEKIEKKEKKVFLFSIREIIPENLNYIKVDAFINTACPRVTIDEALRFRKPILTPKEVEILIGDKKWEEYEMDEF